MMDTLKSQEQAIDSIVLTRVYHDPSPQVPLPLMLFNQDAGVEAGEHEDACGWHPAVCGRATTGSLSHASQDCDIGS